MTATDHPLVDWRSQRTLLQGVPQHSRVAACLRIPESSLCPHCGACPGLFGYDGCGLHSQWHRVKCERYVQAQHSLWHRRALECAQRTICTLEILSLQLPKAGPERHLRLSEVTWSPILVPWIWFAAEEAGRKSTSCFIERLITHYRESPVKLDTCGQDGAELLRGAWNETVQGFALLGITSADHLATSIIQHWEELREWSYTTGRFAGAVRYDPPMYLEPWCDDRMEPTYIKDYVQEWVIESIETALNSHHPGACQNIVVLPNVFCALLDALSGDTRDSEVSTQYTSTVSSKSIRPDPQSLETARQEGGSP
mmetsp:Transcript_59763/g.126552  ORF Transcript_59763/g.126552 Transcript_59763/m.126552 type:complete len:312 (-) Transcript_59763:206-1141(-)